MKLDEKQFITGFNSGYVLAKHEPVMLSTVIKGLQSDNSYIQGLMLGQKEFEQEQSISRLNDIYKLRYENGLEKENDIK